MKEGYIVWNESISGSEFFGVYRSLPKAERVLKRVKRLKYGKMTDEEIANDEGEYGESLKITAFTEHFREGECDD